MYKTIVVGVDGSETSDKAVRTASRIAKEFSSDMHLVHTPQPQTVAFALGAVAGYHAATTMPSHEEVAKAAQKIVDDAVAVAKAAGCDVSGRHTDAGDPADEIVACAEDVGADLIVTGRRGLGSVGAFVQGSTTAKVNHLAKCATLSVI